MWNKVLKVIGISLVFVVLLTMMTSDSWAQRGPGGWGPGRNPPHNPGEEHKVTWRTDDFAEAFAIARKERQLLFLYLYFKDKEDLPPNYDRELRKCSENRAVFAKVLVRTDSKGEIYEKEIANFYKRNKISNGPIALILDHYGNLLNKLTIPTNSTQIIDTIENADKKIIDIEKDLNKRWERVKELQKKEKQTEVLKDLNQIIKTNWRGYKAFVNAQKELDKLNKPYDDKFKEIIKTYLNAKESERDKEGIIKQLENLIKEVKDLPVEACAKEARDKIKKDELPQLDEDEPVDEEEEKEEKDKPPSKDKDSHKDIGDELFPSEKK